MLEEVEPGISKRPRWIWGEGLLNGSPRSNFMLPESDLPTLAEVLARVEAQALDSGLPLSASSHYEMNYVVGADRALLEGPD